MSNGFNTRLYLAFAAISVLIVVATVLAIYRLDGLWRVINTTEKKTFPETLAAMQLSQKSFYSQPVLLSWWPPKPIRT